MEQKELVTTLYKALEDARNFIISIEEEIAKKQYNYVRDDTTRFETAHWVRIKDLAKKLVEFKEVVK